jgi:hypothetical protein
MRKRLAGLVPVPKGPLKSGQVHKDGPQSVSRRAVVVRGKAKPGTLFGIVHSVPVC